MSINQYFECRLGIVLLILLSAGCATGQKNEIPIVPEAPTHHVDFQAVQHDLEMDVSPGWTGYREKRFNACRMSQDLPHIHDCSHAYFVEIGVQLSCRPTEDAQNNILDQGELTPVGNRQLKWQLGQSSGRITTDADGVGLILAIASSSQKKQGLRVSTGEDFLVMRAGEATRIVTPVSWCK